MITYLSFELTTGFHDKNVVKKMQLDRGDIAVHIPNGAKLAETNYLAIDEPEAFLHPSAQRDPAALSDQQVNDGNHPEGLQISTGHSKVANILAH